MFTLYAIFQKSILTDWRVIEKKSSLSSLSPLGSFFRIILILFRIILYCRGNATERFQFIINCFQSEATYIKLEVPEKFKTPHNYEWIENLTRVLTLCMRVGRASTLIRWLYNRINCGIEWSVSFFKMAFLYYLLSEMC